MGNIAERLKAYIDTHRNILINRLVVGVANNSICRSGNIRDAPWVFNIGIAIIVIYNYFRIVILTKALSKGECEITRG